MELDSFFAEAAARSLNLCEAGGAQYSDIRLIQTERENYSASNGRLAEKSESASTGFGIRVLVGGAWGFAASNRLSLAQHR